MIEMLSISFIAILFAELETETSVIFQLWIYKLNGNEMKTAIIFSWSSKYQ